MAYFNSTKNSSGNMTLIDRSLRIGFGLTIIFYTLHLSISGGENHALIKLLAMITVLTGIAGWDPFYSAYRKAISKMSNMETMIFSSGNISMPDRALRIGLGLTVIIASLQVPIGGTEAFPFVKLFATFIVLTGISGWDPVYEGMRRSISYLKNMKPRGYLAHLYSN